MCLDKSLVKRRFSFISQFMGKKKQLSNGLYYFHSKSIVHNVSFFPLAAKVK